MPPSEDEARLDDDEFGVPEDPVEQERFKLRLIATTNSLKKKQQQLQADQDLLADRWTEVLAAEEYELERPSKSYPKRRLLPRSEEEAPKATSPAHDTADREVEDDNYTPPSEDEASLDDDEFVIPSDPAEQERFKRRLLATASSLKKKQQ